MEFNSRFMGVITAKKNYPSLVKLIYILTLQQYLVGLTMTYA
jgi:hypothetical protein